MDQEITDEERTNEVGLFHTAESYWKSAAALYAVNVKASHARSPVLFLYYHAIELYLKAFLRGNGHSAKELRGKKFGHKICCLIPHLIDQNPCAHWRNPMDMIFQGRSTSMFQA
jgi:hypothetical protein